MFGVRGACKITFDTKYCAEGESCPSCGGILTYAYENTYICMDCYYTCE